jgi:DNA invertase Pin-like site-specific DNA recombinase
VAYIRVSTDEQSASIEAQRAAIESIAKQRGLDVVSWQIDENVSGTLEIGSRPALSDALKTLADNDADRLVVAKLDRFARNTIVALQLDKLAAKQGWAIVFGDLDINTSTAVGKMQLSMFASLAQFERDRISERTREALAVKRSQGVTLGRRAVLPFAVVKRIVTERQDGKSLRAIAAGLTDDAIPTARGGEQWQVSAIQSVLASQQARKLVS